MSPDVLKSKIEKAKEAMRIHKQNGEWREAETKESLIMRLEDLLISQQRELAMEGEKV